MQIRLYSILVFLLLFFSAIAQPAISPDPYLKFDHLSKRDGLSNNYVLGFCQDKSGFIWVATKEGLNRYDGYGFKVFKHDPLDSLSISDNVITSLAVDASGNIWAGTRNGLNKYNPLNGHFTRFYFSDSTNQSKEADFIRAILPEDSVNIWVETADGLLHKLNPFQKTEISYSHGKPSMINTYYYHTIYKDKNEDLWIGGRYMGIYKFDTDSLEFVLYREDPDNSQKKRDNDVSVYFEDSEGTFWVSGTDGLYTFDRSSEIFKKNLPVSTFSIQEDIGKKLWIGTGNGIYVLDKQKNEFRHFVHNDNNLHSLINDHVNKVFIDRNQNVWIGTTDGISIYKPSKNKFGQIYHIPENDNTPVSNHITSILEDGKNRIWVGSASEGLECFDKNFNKLFQYNTKSNSSYQLVSNKISTIKQDEEGDIFVGLWSGRGFHIVNPDKGKIKQYQLHKRSLKADWYHDFLQDSNDNFWIGIWGAQGLYKFDKHIGKFMNDRFVSYLPHFKYPVPALAHDGTNIWLTYEGQGRFFCLDPITTQYRFYSRDYYSSFDFSKITDIYSDKKGKVWFQTNKGVYLKNDLPYFSFSLLKENHKPVQNQFDKKTLERVIGTTVLSFIDDDIGNSWVGTYEGLYKMQYNAIEKVYRFSPGNGLVSDTIWSLDYNPPGELWIGTNKGICMLDIPEDKFISYNDPKEVYLSSHLISFIFEDKNGFIWAGTTNNGVNRLNTKNGHIDQFLSNPQDSVSFWGGEASCIYQDSQGIIWIGGDGLNVFNPETETFSHITESDGLSNNEISCILEDNNGFLWISTKYGLSKLNVANMTFENFFEKDGLPENEFSGAGCKLENGLLLFGGKNGISVVDPENLHQDDLSPNIAITDFKIFEKTYDFNFSRNESLKLKYDQNYFSFEFTALDFSDPLLNTFAYKLENFDNDWHYTHGINRIAKYTNVDPGHYTFHVKAANMDGVWNETGLSVSLIIRPPFWRTTWFYMLEIILLVAVVFFIVKYREKKMREQNKFLMLEQKLLRSQMNPHFIFNSLSSIQSFIFESNPIEAGSYLSRFAELIRSILYNSREEFIPLEKEIKTLQNYFDLQQLRYNHKFDYEIDVDLLLEIENISIPPMLAQPFIENAIEHGIKHLDEKGLISVSFTLMMDETLLLMVEDNGIGIKAAKKMKNKKGEEHKSLATIITKERIEILNKGKRKKLYSMQINDTFDANGKVDGTKVKFILPLIQT